VDSTYWKAEECEINIQILVLIYKERHHLGIVDLEARQGPSPQATPLGKQSSCDENNNQVTKCSSSLTLQALSLSYTRYLSFLMFSRKTLKILVFEICSSSFHTGHKISNFLIL